jgi:hypothetical protein
MAVCAAVSSLFQFFLPAFAALLFVEWRQKKFHNNLVNSKQADELLTLPTLTETNELLEPFESVIWSRTPAKETVMLQSFAGVWIALFFGTFPYLMLNLGVPLLGFPIILIALSVALVVFRQFINSATSQKQSIW